MGVAGNAPVGGRDRADGWVRVWDVGTSAELAAAPVAAGLILSLALTADGATGVIGCADGSVRRVRFTHAE